MNDLISRQAAIDEIDEWIKAFLESGHKESAADACLIQDGIIQLPSAQPERPKGEWIDNETSYADGVRQTCTCSVCGIRSVRPLGDFCRWCGADMREDTDNKTTVCPMCFDCPDNCPFGADMRKENR